MKRWMIAYNENLKAAEKVVAAIMPYIDYVPICEKEPKEGYNAIKLIVDENIRGISINVSEADCDEQSIELIGEDEIHLLYAVADFKNIYLPMARSAERHQTPYYFKQLFNEPLKPYVYHSEPKIKNRGIWLWGHTIFDYRRFIDNMLELKLNILIIWNDFPPVNINRVIEYAHENGVEIYLGFAWGWDTKMPETITEEYYDGIVESAVNAYTSQYLRIPCDGIYFQTFTENMPDSVNGVSVAERAMSLVNEIGGKLLEINPTLKIQFGLHAGCALNNLEAIAQVDHRIDILWEDVGAFPYHYLPNRIDGFEETLENTRKIRDLRNSGFGAVLKGVTCLDWDIFEHQEGSFILATYDRKHIKEKLHKKREILRYIQSGWIRNARYAQEIIKEFHYDSVITCLVEESVFEEMINYPTAIYAALLWDSNRDIGDILYEVAQRPDVDFV